MTVKKRVENILAISKRARNSDKELWIIYAQKAGVGFTPFQLDIIRQDLPNFETISRIRRKLQEQGKFEATPEVNEHRFKAFKRVRVNIVQDGVRDLL